MKLKLSRIGFLILPCIIVTTFACACSNLSSNTMLKFDFITSSFTDSEDSKIIYINNDMEKLELNAALKVDAGEVTIQVVNALSDETMWSEKYKSDSDFKIELFNLKANDEYMLEIHTSQTKKVSFTVTTNAKLVKDKGTPKKHDKYNIG